MIPSGILSVDEYPSWMRIVPGDDVRELGDVAFEQPASDKNRDIGCDLYSTRGASLYTSAPLYLQDNVNSD